MKTDSKIKQDVLDELKWEPSVNEPGIGVAVDDGVVTLTGYVDSFAERIAAELAAKRVTGVRAVVEDIKVKLIGDDKRTDVDIAQAALNNLRWNNSVPKDKVLVKVEDGWITLEGEVFWNFQKEAAQKAVGNLRGVKGIVNMIHIRSKIEPYLVKDNIRKTFQRNAILDAEKIDVAVEGHKITLTGNVESWSELRQAGRAAWSSPGVWEVENKLVLKPHMIPSLTAGN